MQLCLPVSVKNHLLKHDKDTPQLLIDFLRDKQQASTVFLAAIAEGKLIGTPYEHFNTEKLVQASLEFNHLLELMIKELED